MLRTFLRSLAVIGLGFAALSQSQTPADPFLEKPYIQLGDSPRIATDESLMLLWHTENTPAQWKVEVRTSKDPEWRQMAAPSVQAVNAPGIPEHRVYRTLMNKLVPGEEFRYRVLKGDQTAFEATARARKSVGQPYRFVLFGDCAQNTPSQRAIAYQTALTKPDFVFITGDIVYGAGRISEYRDHYFPVYNADQATADGGAPLIRSTLFIAAPGNHDTALANFGRFPDALAYFLYWDMPLNGPVASPGATKAAHALVGNPDAQPAFLEGAKPRYPAMANFSFDYGNSHWTVLDSNPYMDWNNPELRAWVVKDLAAAKNAAWRFVAFHHPGFNSSKEHFTDQWMRVLSPVFEAGNVDVVFSGHVHNYQRTFPLTFAPKPREDGSVYGPKGEVAGEWKFDKEFADGAKAKPHGIIYLVSGAGGAALYNPEQQGDPSSWQPFTTKYIADTHSLTYVEIEGKTMRVRQISETGTEVDAFRIAK